MNQKEFKAALAELEKTNEPLATEISNQLAAANQAVESANAENERLTAELESANQAVEDLKSELDEMPESKLKVPGTVKIGGSTYRFKDGFVKTRWNGEVVKSEDLLKNKEAMAHLVKIAYGGIEKV